MSNSCGDILVAFLILQEEDEARGETDFSVLGLAAAAGSSERL